MDQVHVVRHKVLVDGRTQRSVARELGMSRVTVRKHLDQAAPGAYGASARERPVWAVVAPRIEALLAASVRWTGGKQRLTATRLHGLLREEAPRGTDADPALGWWARGAAWARKLFRRY